MDPSPHSPASRGGAPAGRSRPGDAGPSGTTYVADSHCPEPRLGDGAHGHRGPAEEAERGAQQRSPGQWTAVRGGHLNEEATRLRRNTCAAPPRGEGVRLREARAGRLQEEERERGKWGGRAGDEATVGAGPGCGRGRKGAARRGSGLV